MRSVIFIVLVLFVVAVTVPANAISESELGFAHGVVPDGHCAELGFSAKLDGYVLSIP